MLTKIIKKLIPALFILAIVVSGFFFLKNPTSAAVSCTGVDGSGTPSPDANCLGFCPNTRTGGYDSSTKFNCSNQAGWLPTINNSRANTTAQQTTGDENNFEKKIAACDTFWFTPNCLFVKISYFVLVVAPSFLMVFVAKFFNFVTALTLSSDIYRAPFIAKIWTVVRDFSNIMFILMLLYAAIQIILNLGHGGGKQIVASVIMVALLVNFSLFFTRIVIDASNITALIFYNKIDTSATPNIAVGAVGEKDMAGALVSRFNPNYLFGGTFFEDIQTDPDIQRNGISTFLKLGIMLIYGIIAYALVYAFLMGALSMFGRMLNLMMLLIISPFAFVTRAIPSLGHMDSVGFDSWLKNLIKTSFMATIFIFIIYITSEILASNPFSVSQTSNLSVTGRLVVLFMPAVLIIILLLKGVKYAKSASGQFTDMVMKGAGLAGGAVLGGTAILGTGLIGGGAKALTSKYGESLRGATGNKGISGFAARAALKSTNYAQKASFDVRQAPGMGAISSATGINLSQGVLKDIGLGPKQGGLKAKIAEKEKALKEEAKLYETSMSSDDVKKWSKGRMDAYEEQKKKAEEDAKKAGKTFDAVQYEKENKPKAYTSADQLNHDRVKAFQDTLGIDGLLGAAMYSTVGRVAGGLGYNEEQKKKAALNAKRLLGLSYAMATGNVVGSAVGMGATGVALGAGYAGGYAATEGAGEDKFIKDYSKEHGKVGKIDARIKQNDDLIAAENKYLKEEVRKDGEMFGDTPGKDLVTADGKVNQDKIQELLSKIVFQEQKSNAELQALSNKIIAQGGVTNDDDKNIEIRIRKEMIETASLKNKLTTIKTSPERIANAQRDNDRLNEMRDKLHDKAHAADAAHATPAATPAAAHAEPAHTPAPSGGGGGHDAAHH